VAAVATALRERPDVNGAYRDGHLERYGRVNVAVSTGDATLVVHDADTSDAAQIGAALDRLRARAAAGELTAAETAGPTFVIAPSSARRLEPVVAPGFAAVLGAGAPDERAVVDDGALTTGTRMDLVLACDARALSAQAGASFLARLVELLAQ
jgi:pyruvate dehydrogenase E2 component (dihydrolipoamide acetyltransferase)